MPPILDDKSEHCIPFILERLAVHQAACGANPDAPPFFLGLNGVQGAGKTTLVSTLCSTLRSPPYSLPTVVLSIDDLYLPHAQQTALAAAHADNPLVQHRGEPGTHDLALGRAVFDALARRAPTRVPVYDKAAFAGQGDRTDPASWELVNAPGTPPVQVVVFEGWCVGFRPLDDAVLREKWAAARTAREAGADNVIGRHQLQHLEFVNEALRGYNGLTDKLDALIHIDAEDTNYVYKWRLQQEAALRREKGTGMTDEQVVKFVDGYYPAYELFTETLRAGVFPREKGKQLRLVVGEDRKVKQVIRL